MENHKNNDFKDEILNKLGINLEEFNKITKGECHEKDNETTPFDKLSLEELLYVRENNYLLN